MTDIISSFSGQYRFLSNFWIAVVDFEGITYPSSEHAYQASKSLGRENRMLVAQQSTPALAKRTARSLPLRQDWGRVKQTIMRQVLEQKFHPVKHPELVQWLLATGEAELIEGNDWGDVYWGVCRGVGKNHLGNMLMETRLELGGRGMCKTHGGHAE